MSSATDAAPVGIEVDHGHSRPGERQPVRHLTAYAEGAAGDQGQAAAGA